MLITYKYKLYNSKKNKKLDKLSTIARWIYNHCVALERRYYKLYGKFISKYTLQKHIAKLRNRNAEWMLLGAQTVQMITHRVADAYIRFFKKLAVRPPKFKKKGFKVSLRFTQRGYSLKDNKFTINTINTIFKFHKSREYGNVKSITVKKSTTGDWYINIVAESIQYNKTSGSAALGIDFGLKTYLTLSDGSTISSPQFFKQDLDNISKLSKTLSRTRRGSNNRAKARINLAKAHQRVVNRRDDFQWKLANKILNQAKFIAIEDLDINAMKKRWGRKVSDLAFGSFVEKLLYLSVKYDVPIQKVGRYFPSSKLCSCGTKNDKLSLSDRYWKCDACGATHNRDILAAVNILSEGIRLYRTKCNTDMLLVA